MPLLSCVGGRRLPARKGNIVNIPRTRHRIYRAALYTRHSIAGGNACGATHRETCEILRRPHSARRRVSERARCHANLLAAAAFEALQHPTTFLCETSVSPDERCLSYLDRNSPGRRRRLISAGVRAHMGRCEREVIAGDWRLPFPVLSERVAASLFSNRRAFPSFQVCTFLHTLQPSWPLSHPRLDVAVIATHCHQSVRPFLGRADTARCAASLLPMLQSPPSLALRNPLLDPLMVNRNSNLLLTDTPPSRTSYTWAGW